MKAGWKTRIEERRYFEEKRREWFVRVLNKKMFVAQMKFREKEADEHLKLLARPITSSFQES